MVQDTKSKRDFWDFFGDGIGWTMGIGTMDVLRI